MQTLLWCFIRSNCLSRCILYYCSKKYEWKLMHVEVTWSSLRLSRLALMSVPSMPQNEWVCMEPSAVAPPATYCDTGSVSSWLCAVYYIYFRESGTYLYWRSHVLQLFGTFASKIKVYSRNNRGLQPSEILRLLKPAVVWDYLVTRSNLRHDRITT